MQTLAQIVAVHVQRQLAEKGQKNRIYFFSAREASNQQSMIYKAPFNLGGVEWVE